MSQARSCGCFLASQFDLFVIGGGSGGVRAARIAATHGARVALAESDRVGGTCVIRGCVPKKMLAYGSHFAEDLRDARHFGWQVPECDFDWSTLKRHVFDDVTRLEGLMTETLERSGVTLFSQHATIAGPNRVRLADGTIVHASKILIATGARPERLSIPGGELPITSNEAFHLDDIPRRMTIIGGGYIANEFAGIFAQFGATVTIICRSPNLLMAYDHSLRDRLLSISLGKGIRVHTSTTTAAFERVSDGSILTHTREHDPIAADVVLLAIGRAPNVERLGLAGAGVATGAGGEIIIDDKYQTNIPSIFAIGDVTDRVQLTPVAILEGHAFADRQFGDRSWQVRYDCIPSAVFSNPPIAAVGLTEQQARDAIGDVAVHTSDFRPLRNTLAQRNENALYKMVCDAQTDRILGIHMIGPDAPEILQAAAISVSAGLTKAQFDDTVSIFPTMAEELVEMS